MRTFSEHCWRRADPSLVLVLNLGTDYGCWPAQPTAELRATDRPLKLPLWATLSLGRSRLCVGRPPGWAPRCRASTWPMSCSDEWIIACPAGPSEAVPDTRCPSNNLDV